MWLSLTDLHPVTNPLSLATVVGRFRKLSLCMLLSMMTEQ
jgi:hypothetical protein